MNIELIEDALAGEDFSKPYTLLEAALFFWEKSLLDTGELAEQGIAKASGISQNKRNTQGSDLTDGTEVKYATVFHDARTTYATIGGFKNKTGMIRARIYAEKTKKNYYFLIPYSVYSEYFNTKTTMKVWFDSNGNPRNPTKNTYTNLWLHKIDKKTFMAFTE